VLLLSQLDAQIFVQKKFVDNFKEDSMFIVKEMPIFIFPFFLSATIFGCFYGNLWEKIALSTKEPIGTGSSPQKRK
jgi:hypothetical protein